MVAKAEHIDGKENPRFVVTSLTSERWAAQALYEELYCGRGDMENRIKEQFSLFADRVSAETMRANQLRLYLSALAYILVSGSAPSGTERDRTGAGAGLHHPDEAAEDRRADPGFGSQGLGLDGFQLSLARPLSAGLDEPALLKRQQRGRYLQIAVTGKTGSDQCAATAPQSPHKPAEPSADPRSIAQIDCRFFVRS